MIERIPGAALFRSSSSGFFVNKGSRSRNVNSAAAPKMSMKSFSSSGKLLYISIILFIFILGDPKYGVIAKDCCLPENSANGIGCNAAGKTNQFSGLLFIQHMMFYTLYFILIIYKVK